MACGYSHCKPLSPLFSVYAFNHKRSITVKLLSIRHLTGNEGEEYKNTKIMLPLWHQYEFKVIISSSNIQLL